MGDDKKDVAMDIANAKRRRGVARGSITRIETRIAQFEGKMKFTASDRLTIQRLQQKLESSSTEFKTLHLFVMEHVEDEARAAEQADLDDHENKVTELEDRFDQLCARFEDERASAPAAEPSVHLQRRVDDLMAEVKDI